MSWNPVKLPMGTIVLVHADAHGVNDKGPFFYKSWIQALISELNSTLGDDLIWLDYIEPMTGQWVYNVPHKLDELKEFPTNKNPLQIPPPRKHVFSNDPHRDTAHGRPCINCGINSFSSEADMPCRNE